MLPGASHSQRTALCCCRAGRRKHHALVPGQWSVLVYAFLAVGFLGALAVSGNLDYHYFTYWGWTWQATWSTLWSVFIVCDARGTTRGAEGVWLFMSSGFSLSYLTVVGVIITAVPAEEGTSWVLEMSDGTSLGLANLGNLWAHYVPWAVATMLVIARRDAVAGFVSEADALLAPMDMGWVITSWLWTSCVAGMVALSNVWSAWFDFNRVYLTSVDEWVAFLMGVGGIVAVAAMLSVTAFKPPSHTHLK